VLRVDDDAAMVAAAGDAARSRFPRNSGYERPNDASFAAVFLAEMRYGKSHRWRRKSAAMSLGLKRWWSVGRAVLVRSVLLLLFLFLAMTSIGVFFDREQPSWERSIHGVSFLIRDREALVCPSNYFSRDDMEKLSAPVQNLSFCVRLPNMTLHGDVASRRGCMAVGRGSSDWMVMSLNGEGFGRPPPASTQERGFGFVLRRWVKHDGQGPGRASGETYLAADPQYELRTYHPTGPNVGRASPTIFWDGPDIYHVDTWILCTGYLPSQNSDLKRCTHEFYLPSEMFGGYGVRVVLYYHEQWLPEWRTIQNNSLKAILDLRVHQASE
jgi:hypothetical protein